MVRKKKVARRPKKAPTLTVKTESFECPDYSQSLRDKVVAQQAALDSVAKLLVAHGLHSQAVWDPAHLSVLGKALNDPARGLLPHIAKQVEVNQSEIYDLHVEVGAVAGSVQELSNKLDDLLSSGIVVRAGDGDVLEVQTKHQVGSVSITKRTKVRR